MNKSTHRTLFARPLVFAVGVGVAPLVNPALQSGLWLQGIIGIFAVANLALAGLWWAFSGRGLTRHVPLVSPILGLIGWGMLAVLTGGVRSPFVAAIFFEIALAVFSMGPLGVWWVTGHGVVIMLLGEALGGFPQGWHLLALEMVFVTAIGGLGAAMARRRRAGEVAVSQGEVLGQRLELLQKELEDERVVSRVGENVARLAHGLKNAVHSLRGFVALIEPQLDRESGASAALAGLRAAIDDLEKLARMTLADHAEPLAPPGATPRDPSKNASVAAVVEEARRELTTASPEVHWTLLEGDDADGLIVGLGEATMLELLVILMRNAVEAMDGKGQAVVEYGRTGDSCRLVVRDQGPGFDPEALSRIFQPGYTTKQTGSGFGLFLARRIVEDHGGRLELASGDPGGAVVRVELPLVRVEEAV